MQKFKQRKWVGVSLGSFLILVRALALAQISSLPVWQEGNLDIHHISTGSGNASFFIFPDGTTMILDVGEVDRVARMSRPNPLKASPRLPHDSISAAQCIASYIKQVLPSAEKIDYGLITHFHSDHFGSLSTSRRNSVRGNYRLTGITELNEYMPIRKIIDRNYPKYDYPVDLRKHVLDKETFVNYLEFINTLVAKNLLKVEALEAGSKTQIIQKTHPEKFPNFIVRNLKSNGRIWTGSGSSNTNAIPDSISLTDYNENLLSIALKISYGNFDYFTGGDMTGLQGFGLPKWFDMETPVARVTGKVEAMSLNHHGVRDASNDFFLKTLAPRVLVQQSWSSNHPGEEVLHRIISPATFPGKRDIFATYIHEETRVTYGRWLDDNYLAKHGHIVIRVLPGGDQFLVYVLDDTILKLNVLGTFGPYESR